MKKLIRDEQGQALVLALILLLIGGLIAAPLLAYMGTGLLTGEVYDRRTAELYAADAGVEDAIWKIQSGSVNLTDCDSTYGPYTIPNVNDRDVTVTITLASNTSGHLYNITSVATSDGGSRTRVESHVFYGSEWGQLLNFGVVALDGNIEIGQNTVLDSYPEPSRCHLYANGNIFIVDNAHVCGSATATGTITVGRRARLSPGPRISGLTPPLELNLPNIDKYLDQAKQQTHTGDLEITQDCTLGPLYITGSLRIGGNAVLTLGGPVWVDGTVTATGTALIKGKGPLVAVGQINVNGTDRPAPDEMPVLISTQNSVGVTGTGKVYAVLYAPNQTITLEGTAGVNGAIIGKSVTIRTAGVAKVYYDLTVVDRVRVPGVGILTWEVSHQ